MRGGARPRLPALQVGGHLAVLLVLGYHLLGLRSRHAMPSLSGVQCTGAAASAVRSALPQLPQRCASECAAAKCALCTRSSRAPASRPCDSADRAVSGRALRRPQPVLAHPCGSAASAPAPAHQAEPRCAAMQRNRRCRCVLPSLRFEPRVERSAGSNPGWSVAPIRLPGSPAAFAPGATLSTQGRLRRV